MSNFLSSEQKNTGATRNGWQTFSTLLPYLWPKGNFPIRLRVVIAVFCLLAAKIATVYVPVLYKHAVDKLGTVATGDGTAWAALPIGFIAAYGLARIMSQGFGELRDAAFARVSARSIRQIALQTFQHLHSLSLRFHLDRRTGGMIGSIERGTKGIETLLRFMLFNIVPTFLEIALVCGILWYTFNGWYALVTLITLVGYIAFTMAVTTWRVKFYRIMNENDNDSKSKAVDSLLNYETVKYFTNETHESHRYEEAMRGYEKAMVKNTVSLSFLNIGQAVIISVGLTIVMVMAARGVLDKSMTIGDFVLVNTYLLQLGIPLGFLGFVYREIRLALINMEDMFQLLTIGAEVQDVPDAKPLQVAGGEVAFSGVSFGYDARRMILQDVSFTVPAGKTVAIVGSSGAGKSTISRLLFRFYEPQQGGVLIDGQDIRQVQQTSLRQAIGIVPQDTVLFNDTVFYNIAYGRPNATPAEVEQAARLAHIHDFIMSLPDGYQSMVGERGLKLSGGEKQRVAIARTILKNPQILLFDEATSALDSRTEKEIQASLREISVDRTTLIIAHRLSTVVDADEILVLDQGQIIERGRHTALLESNGRYAEMWQRQQEVAQVIEADKDALSAVVPA